MRFTRDGHPSWEICQAFQIQVTAGPKSYEDLEDVNTSNDIFQLNMSINILPILYKLFVLWLYSAPTKALVLYV